jgi:hypothetical protein
MALGRPSPPAARLPQYAQQAQRVETGESCRVRRVTRPLGTPSTTVAPGTDVVYGL